MQPLIPLKKRIFIGFIFYFVFGAMYWLANSLQTEFKFNMWQEALVDYSLKGILTVPVWWFLFVYLKDKPLSFRLKWHLIACPLYVWAWFWSFRFFAIHFDLYYLKGTGRVWDVYIPMLFYCLQFGFFHAYEYWENHQLQMLRESELRETMKVAAINNYKAQLQPHFLFNTLNSINSTLTNNEPARELIARLADSFRYAMQISDKQQITLGEELRFNQNCLELEQARFSERLQLRFEVDQKLLDCKVPPMILQPIIENAIKHGISKQIEGGSILVSVQSLADDIVFRITNSGNWVEQLSDSVGIGLANTRKRLELLYGTTLEIETSVANFVTVQCRIPIER